MGTFGKVVGIDRFGESAPAEVVFEHFGFTVENVVAAARSALAETDGAPVARAGTK